MSGPTERLEAIRVVAEMAASPMCVVSATGEILLVNQPYCEFVGRPRQEVERLGLRGVNHPDDFERDRGAMRALVEGTLDRYETEKRYIRPDGSVVWGIIAATPVRTAAGVIGSFSVVQDITERKRAEQALAVSEEHFRQVLANAPIGTGLLDQDGRWVTVNRALCDITGRSEEELLGHTFVELTHPDDVAEDPAEMAQLLTGAARTSSRRKRYVRPSGEVIWVQVHRSVLFDQAGAPRNVIGQVEDITQRVRAEEFLHTSDSRLHRLAEGAKDFIVFRYRLGSDPGYEYVSPAVEALMGYSPDELYADPRLWREIVHPEDIEILRRLGRPGSGGPQTIRVFHRDGTLRYTEQRGIPIYDEQGVQVGFDAIVVDITSRVDAERRLESRERRFRSLVEKSSDLVVITDAAGVIQHVTPSVQRILGYAPSALQGRNRHDFFHPDDLDAMSAEFASGVAEPGSAFTMEVRVRSAADQWRWLECTATNLLHDPDVAGIVLNARDITERRELHAQLQRRANLDELTGLANWRRLLELLGERTRSAGPAGAVAVLVLGLNRFGAINDTLGYQYGDRLLQAVATRLQQAAGGNTVVARGGGKRFAVLFDLDDPGQLDARVEAILSLFEEPFVVEGQPLQLDASGGVALYPEDGDDEELLLRRAEAARRRARSTGAAFGRSATDPGAAGAGQIRYLGQLREAIDTDRLVLHYQPKVDVETRLVRGAEALVRWRHPDEGWVQPAQFIPLAEESGLIRPLTRWVLGAAIEQAKRWREGGISLPVAVNVTARNLQDPSFVDTVAAALQDSGTPPSELCLEITERSVMTDPVVATATCHRLSQLGLRLSLDDFGTGQSALAYLVSLPIDEIKIDRTFVVALQTKLESRAVVRAIVELASDLGKDVVAEGVEDAATADLLVSLGCSTMQGYLYSQPVPVDEIGPWLDAGGWKTAGV